LEGRGRKASNDGARNSIPPSFHLCFKYGSKNLTSGIEGQAPSAMVSAKASAKGLFFPKSVVSPGKGILVGLSILFYITSQLIVYIQIQAFG